MDNERYLKYRRSWGGEYNEAWEDSSKIKPTDVETLKKIEGSARLAFHRFLNSRQQRRNPNAPKGKGSTKELEIGFEALAATLGISGIPSQQAIEIMDKIVLESKTFIKTVRGYKAVDLDKIDDKIKESSEQGLLNFLIKQAKPLTASEIMQLTGFNQGLIYRHLFRLKSKGLVKDAGEKNLSDGKSQKLFIAP